MKQLPLAIAVATPGTFGDYVVGPNAAAVQHLRALGAGAAPVYLWGPAGVGKTHLLQAAAGLIEHQRGRVRWFGSNDSPGAAPEGAWSLIVFDDCDAFDAERQQRAFALFVDATTDSIPVIAAGRVPPVDLPLRDDLRTRLAWGHVFAIEPLAESDVRAVLQREAGRRGIALADEVVDYLLNRFARDLKHLMLQLDELDTFSLVQKRAITVPLLRQMLAEEAEARREP
jgi:DnaA family protein